MNACTGSGVTAFARRQPTPWHRAAGLSAVLDAWRREERVRRHMVLDVERPATAARTVPFPADLPVPVRTALEAQGVRSLYAHQARAYEAARKRLDRGGGMGRGGQGLRVRAPEAFGLGSEDVLGGEPEEASRDLVVSTPTASGKSLCYHLPVLDVLARRQDARAIYLFPTKALARDQENGLRDMLAQAGLHHGAVVYDGDTSPDARRAARGRSGILISNPDMLHTAILPHHTAWTRLFANLQYVVLDEVHAYRGVFGAHLSNLIRRLMRVASFHGSTPTFLMSSATIGNPAEHAARLIGRSVLSIEESGAPSGPRHVMVYNPPLVNPELGLRQSCIKAAVRLALDLVRARVPTIIFGSTRNQVEVMLKYLRDRTTSDADIPPGAIQAYRGGYLPETRRRIEAGLRDGSVRCVVSTNALELGIDIGALGAAVSAGFPGTMSGLWQRFGRAGRRKEPSLSLLVSSSAPLDQFIANRPELILHAPIEHARIDPDNVEILLQHLKCGAFELPFASVERFGDVPADIVGEALDFLAQHRVVRAVPGRQGERVYHWAADSYPANAVSLRSPSWDNFVVVERDTQKTIAEMDFRSTHTMLHEQAIYQHEGRQYQVEFLDYANHKAFVRQVEPDYYTTAMTRVKVSVLHEEQQVEVHVPGLPISLSAGWGEVNVVEKVVGYKKIKFHTHENVGYGEVTLPELHKPTTAFWWILPDAFLRLFDAPRAVLMDALSGIQAAMHAVASVGLMMDPSDLGRTVEEEPAVSTGRDGTDRRTGAFRGPAHVRSFEPILYFYDTVAGGAGLAPRLFEERENLIHRALDLIRHCACSSGCPSCVGAVMEVDARDVDRGWSRRQVAERLLQALSDAVGPLSLPTPSDSASSGPHILGEIESPTPEMNASNRTPVRRDSEPSS
ncbi:MAG: DEAD/DEAH box helicase [Myxococcota bacterium]